MLLLCCFHAGGGGGGQAGLTKGGQQDIFPGPGKLGG